MSAFMPSPTNRRRDSQAQEDEPESELETEVIIVIRTRRYHIYEENDYIRERIRSWTGNFKNEDLWEQFRYDFADWDEVRFRLSTSDALRGLRTHLRLHKVWVRKGRGIVIPRTLTNVMKKETQHRERRKK